MSIDTHLVITTKTRSIALVAGCLVAGCSQIIGLKEPTMGEDDGGVSGKDAPNDGPDSDGLNTPKLWMFTTNGVYDGNFDLADGGRVAADAKCDDMYRTVHMARQCSHVHAVIQVDNINDTLTSMAVTFQIPSGIPALRATDAIRIADQWGDVIDRNVNLLAPVSTSGISIYFWSGRGVSVNRQCNSWKSNDPALFGDAGDATKSSGWLSQTSFACDSLTPHLLCVCW